MQGLSSMFNKKALSHVCEYGISNITTIHCVCCAGNAQKRDIKIKSI